MSHIYRRTLTNMTTRDAERFGKCVVKMCVAKDVVTYIVSAPRCDTVRFYWHKPRGDELAVQDDYHATIDAVLAYVLAHEHDAGAVKRCAHCRTPIDGGAQGRKRFCSLWCKDEHALAQAKHRRVG